MLGVFYLAKLKGQPISAEIIDSYERAYPGFKKKLDNIKSLADVDTFDLYKEKAKELENGPQHASFKDLTKEVEKRKQRLVDEDKKLLEIFKNRMNLTADKINFIESLEKLVSDTSHLSPHEDAIKGKKAKATEGQIKGLEVVRLNHLRVKPHTRVPVQMKYNSASNQYEISLELPSKKTKSGKVFDLKKKDQIKASLIDFLAKTSTAVGEDGKGLTQMIEGNTMYDENEKKYIIRCDAKQLPALMKVVTENRVANYKGQHTLLSEKEALLEERVVAREVPERARISQERERTAAQEMATRAAQERARPSQESVAAASREAAERERATMRLRQVFPAVPGQAPSAAPKSYAARTQEIPVTRGAGAVIPRPTSSTAERSGTQIFFDENVAEAPGWEDMDGRLQPESGGILRPKTSPSKDALLDHFNEDEEFTYRLTHRFPNASPELEWGMPPSAGRGATELESPYAEPDPQTERRKAATPPTMGFQYKVVQRLAKEARKINPRVWIKGGTKDENLSETFDKFCEHHSTKIKKMNDLNKGSQVRERLQMIAEQRKQLGRNLTAAEYQEQLKLYFQETPLMKEYFKEKTDQQPAKYSAIQRFENKLNTIALYDNLSTDKEPDNLNIRESSTKELLVNISKKKQTDDTHVVNITAGLSSPAERECLLMVLSARDLSKSGKFHIDHCETKPETAIRLYLFGKALGLIPLMNQETRNALDEYARKTDNEHFLGLNKIYKQVLANPDMAKEDIIIALEKLEPPPPPTLHPTLRVGK